MDLASLLSGLYDRPGFKIRRCHQFAVSIFVEECAEHDLTTTQFGLLYVIDKLPGIEQIAAAKMIGLDRSTCGAVVARLEDRGLVKRVVRLDDKRRRQLVLTEKGEALLEALKPLAQRAQERLLAPLDETEREVFQRCLDKLLTAFNQDSRVPLEPPNFGKKRRPARNGPKAVSET